MNPTEKNKQASFLVCLFIHLTSSRGRVGRTYREGTPPVTQRERADISLFWQDVLSGKSEQCVGASI